MKPIITIIFLLFAKNVFSQVDQNGNPVFNSVTTKEETIGNFQLLSNYYTLKNNIDNKGSSVYISDKPTLRQIERAATNLPSDFFVIKKKDRATTLILIPVNPSRDFVVVNLFTGKKEQFKCDLKGDISENRVKEIISENYDPQAKVIDGKFFFSGEKLAIISNEAINKAVLNLINEKKLSISDSSNVKIPSKKELRAIILKESKEGGRLDFFTEIKGHEYDAIQIKPGLIATKSEIALYKWGRANFELGVNTIEDALSIWAELKSRPANSRELNMITGGFNKDLEK